jgi:uncharacterized protein YyaL (SSP411 family)
MRVGAVTGVAGDSADFLLRELRTAEGGFASALDADTEGVEGRFYAWTPAQLREALGHEDGAWAAEVLAVTEAGTHDSPALEPEDQPI